MGDALPVDVGDVSPPGADTLPVKLQAQEPAGVGGGLRESGEDEIPQAVDDGPAAVGLGVLDDVGMAADDRVGACVDHQAGEPALARAGDGLVLPAPVHEGDHQVGTVAAAGLNDVVLDLLVLAPGDPRPVVVRLEAAREEFVIAEEGDTQAVALDDQGPVGLRQVGTAAEVGDTLSVEEGQQFPEGGGAEIPEWLLARLTASKCRLRGVRVRGWARKV